MPRALKCNLDNPFNCPSCAQLFQTRSGLAQHYHQKHRVRSQVISNLSRWLWQLLSDLPDIEVFIQEIDVIPETPSEERPNIPSSPSIDVIPETPPEERPNIPSSPLPETPNNNLPLDHGLVIPEIQDENSDPITQEFQLSDDEELPGLPGEDSDSYVNDSDDSDSDTDIVISDLTVMDIHQKLPEMLELSDVLPHPNAGHICDTSGHASRGFEVQEQEHRRYGHPYYPWTCDNELWLSHFIFFKAKMTFGMADVMLRGIRDGRLKMDNLSITRAHQMLSKIDDGATYVPVCITFDLVT